MVQLYRHSGIVPLSGLLITWAWGITTATVGGIVYSCAAYYVPFAAAKSFLVFGFAILIGGGVLGRARRAKIRHDAVPPIIGLCCGLLGVYIAWAADLVVRMGVPPGRSLLAALDPQVLAAYIGWFYENGLWGFAKDRTVINGVPLAIFWALEAVCIVGFSVYFPWGMCATRVYCVSCDRWVKAPGEIARLHDANAEQLVHQFEAGDFTRLRHSSLAANDALMFLRLTLARCPKCSETNSLGIERVRISVDKDEKRSETTETLLDRLLISADEIRLVRSFCTEIGPRVH